MFSFVITKFFLIFQYLISSAKLATRRFFYQQCFPKYLTSYQLYLFYRIGGISGSTKVKLYYTFRDLSSKMSQLQSVTRYLRLTLAFA